MTIKKAVGVAVTNDEDAAMRIIVRWMMNRSYATGHGDSITDLLNELDWQAQERGRLGQWKKEAEDRARAALDRAKGEAP